MSLRASRRLRSGLRRIGLVVLLMFVLPACSHVGYRWLQGWPASWYQADWSATGVLPGARYEQDAVVHILAARTGRWKGGVAHHSWIVTKLAGARRYMRYDVVGWGHPVRVNAYPPDGRWYSNVPKVVLTLRGREAERAIPQIRQAVTRYPFSQHGDYAVWPGPNSNTFVAHIARSVPALAPGLLSTAIGKDFRNGQDLLALAPSRTGWQISWRGLLGLTVAWVEGLEFNLLGLVVGLDIRRPALKLPGWGRIGVAHS